jgi:hypothetical protein
MAMVANQLNDRVLFFEVNPRASNESLKLVCRSTGGIIPFPLHLHFCFCMIGLMNRAMLLLLI